MFIYGGALLAVSQVHLFPSTVRPIILGAGVICLVLGGTRLARLLFTFAALKRPMLVISDSGLTFRKAMFPWNTISDVRLC